MKSLKVLLLATAAMTAHAEQLTIERINAAPNLDGNAPRALAIAPDGSRVTFLQGKKTDANQYDLWEYNVKAGKSRLLVDSKALAPEEKLSDEELARRERARLFAHGISDYFWSEDSQKLLFPLNGDLYLYDLAKSGAKATRQLTHGEGFITDPKFSPKGRYVSFVRDQNLYVLDLESGKARALTRDGKGTVKNGMAEFVAQEEMKRMTGYWWAGDDKHIAFARIDEAPVDIIERYEIDADGFKTFRQRYPSAGTKNVLITLGVVDVDTGATTWIDLGKDQDIYLARVNWLPDHKTVAVQRQTRDQRTLDLLFADSATGKSHVVLSESAKTWTNLNDDLRFLKTQPAFVWGSERSGYKQLYLVDYNGKVIRPLTEGQWVVNEVRGIDEKAGEVYFDGFADSPLELHLYAASLNGGPLRKLTQGEGWHEVSLSQNATVFVDKFSNPSTPPQVSLNDITGKRVAWLEENRLDKHHPYFPYVENHVVPEYGTLKADDGQTMYYRLYKPAKLEAGRKYPVIVDVYGGPGAQRVQKKWGARGGYWHQFLVQHGYLVFSLDNRGSENRGKAFEDPIFRNMASVEIDDQRRGVEFLKTLPYVDGEHIGVYGHSYGGFMTLMLLMKQPDLFAAGVSGAPVTDWKLYDTHYTERYMDHPAKNAEGYKASSVFPYVNNLKKPLLLIHGMADDNVLFTHSTKLMKALQDAGKPFELMTYPGSKHSLWGESVQNHELNTIVRFFDRELKPATP